ncbi:MAG TPA: hypothetical protein DCK98_06305 [Chloroflexi bacterium]|jgi:hypothetical protein|nr:hypothetical protein [Chloroflexota bacterium]HAL27002.1 hypothetical protein [Chloroflexota bacterium]
MTGRGTSAAWFAYAAIAAVMAGFALLAWTHALLLGGPVLYGEGAVAHAAILSRGLATYADTGGATFTAANYPPLYFVLASVGDPFVTGRILSIAATLVIAGLIAWRARAGGLRIAVALGLGWLAFAPVAIWGPAVKPDLVALALTVAAVVTLERRRAGVAAALLVLAVVTKPTAAVPAVALLVWIAWRDRALLRPFVLGGIVAIGLAALALLPFGYEGLLRHVIAWNALPWTAESAAQLVVLAVVIYAGAVGGALVARAFSGPIAAYAVAAAAVVVLGGREGATINYLLDLGAAASLALASAAPRLARAPFYPVVAVANLVLAALLLDPLGVVPGRAATTGAWGDPSRLTSVGIVLAGDQLVLAEDSGLVVATGHQVVVDDLFLWSRLVSRGALDPGPLLSDIGAARFTAIVSEVDLARLSDAAAYERARWEPSLVRAIDERYRLVARVPGGLFIYRPR